jgi:hypothetical protein
VVEVALKTKVARQATARTCSSLFEFCSGRCRHNSQSVVHENAYANELHHCFSEQLNPSGIFWNCILLYPEVHYGEFTLTSLT